MSPPNFGLLDDSSNREVLPTSLDLLEGWLAVHELFRHLPLLFQRLSHGNPTPLPPPGGTLLRAPPFPHLCGFWRPRRHPTLAHCPIVGLELPAPGLSCIRGGSGGGWLPSGLGFGGGFAPRLATRGLLGLRGILNVVRLIAVCGGLGRGFLDQPLCGGLQEGRLRSGEVSIEEGGGGVGFVEQGLESGNCGARNLPKS